MNGHFWVSSPGSKVRVNSTISFCASRQAKTIAILCRQFHEIVQKLELITQIISTIQDKKMDRQFIVSANGSASQEEGKRIYMSEYFDNPSKIRITLD